MTDHNWWHRPAKEEEKGSFCDSESQVHYDNVSSSEAEELEESAMRRGDGVIEREREIRDYSEDTRFNTNRTAIDGQDHDYPAKLGPGN